MSEKDKEVLAKVPLMTISDLINTLENHQTSDGQPITSFTVQVTTADGGVYRITTYRVEDVNEPPGEQLKRVFGIELPKPKGGDGS